MQDLRLTSAASVTGLSPGGLSAPRHVRPVSYYALFQGWLLLSQPPGCLRAATTLPTEPVVRDLSRRSGLFPSRRRIFAPAVSHPPPAWSSTARPDSAAFVVWFGSVSGKPPRRSSAIPPRRPTGGLHLNAFRGEPAISGFAWHFTATRSSSGPFATDLGSALHRRVPPASAWPRLDHPVSGRAGTTPRPVGLAFAAAAPVPGFASPPPLTRRLILQKARRHRISIAAVGSDRPEAHGFRVCFTPLAGVLFTVPSRYWSTIGRRRYLALGCGHPRFRPDVACPALLTIHRHSAGLVVRLQDSHPLRCPVPAGFASTIQPERGGCRPLPDARPTPPWHRRQAIAPVRFGLLPVRSPLLRESSLLLGVLRCFSSPGALSRIAPSVPGRAPGGLPHSETPGSLAASASPGHFAA